MTTAAPARGPTPNASLPAKVPSIPPNQTLYVTNLPTKIQKEDLRTALYLLFSTYGPVLDVVALKTMVMRGQAHIVYRDVQTSTQAMRHLEGMMFLGRPLKIQYAKSKSHFVAKLDGTFKLPTASTGASNVEQTDLQRSIFDAPAPGAAPAAALPSKPTGASDQTNKQPEAPASQGQKRPREDEDEDDDSDVAMEEESDDE